MFNSPHSTAFHCPSLPEAPGLIHCSYALCKYTRYHTFAAAVLMHIHGAPALCLISAKHATFTTGDWGWHISCSAVKHAGHIRSQGEV